jgi:Bacterial Ig domain
MKVSIVKALCGAAILLLVRTALGGPSFMSTPIGDSLNSSSIMAAAAGNREAPVSAIPLLVAQANTSSSAASASPAATTTTTSTSATNGSVTTTSAPPVVSINATTNNEFGGVTNANQTNGTFLGTFLFSRSGGAEENPLVVYYKISGSAREGQDYQTISTNVTIPANVASTNLNIFPIRDMESPMRLTNTIDLELTAPPSNAPPYTVGSPSNAVVTLAQVISGTTNSTTVQILAPRDGAVFPAGQDILLAALVSNTNGSVTNVEFFANVTNIGVALPILQGTTNNTSGTNTTGGTTGTETGGTNQMSGTTGTSGTAGTGGAASPFLPADNDDELGTIYVFDARGAAVGDYVIMAVASDSTGAVTISAPIHVTVQRTGITR